VVLDDRSSEETADELAPFFTESPIDLSDDTDGSEAQRYITACLSQTGSYQYSNYVINGRTYGVCIKTDNPVSLQLALNNPDEIAGFAETCYNQLNMMITSPLASGQTLGRCITCSGSQTFDTTTNMCVQNEVTCDDGSDIRSCSDVIFNDGGFYEITREIAPGDSSLVFSCNYVDEDTATECRNYCYNNDGGLSGDTCIIPAYPVTTIVVQPNQTYTVNAPAIPEYDLEADPNNGATITFVEPAVIIDSLVKVIVNGTQIQIGCALISPAVCN